MTAEHAENRVLHDFAVDPDHADRSDSPEFNASKKRLSEDGHYKCYVCGSDQNIQIHHYHCEWMFANVADWDKVKVAAEAFDIYGYGRLLKNKPITSPDDIRVMMALCQAHHTGVDHQDGGGGTGIHEVSHPTWNAQKIALDGADPVPQPGETFAAALARIQSHEKPEAAPSASTAAA